MTAEDLGAAVFVTAIVVAPVEAVCWLWARLKGRS